MRRASGECRYDGLFDGDLPLLLSMRRSARPELEATLAAAADMGLRVGEEEEEGTIDLRVRSCLLVPGVF